MARTRSREPADSGVPASKPAGRGAEPAATACWQRRRACRRRTCRICCDRLHKTNNANSSSAIALRFVESELFSRGVKWHGEGRGALCVELCVELHYVVWKFKFKLSSCSRLVI
jgi:hypothetical protein